MDLIAFVTLWLRGLDPVIERCGGIACRSSEKRTRPLSAWIAARGQLTLTLSQMSLTLCAALAEKQ
jgi:hypothetical protein